MRTTNVYGKNCLITMHFSKIKYMTVILCSPKNRFQCVGGLLAAAGFTMLCGSTQCTLLFWVVETQMWILVL